MKQAIFSVTLAEEIETGTLIDFEFNLSSGPYGCSQVFNVPVGLIIEDFETGNFENFGWVMTGDQPWQITEEEVFDGVYSARSGIIGDEQISVISIDVDVAVDDSISFFRKVSCEDDPYNDDYDWLGFYIDNTQVQRWDGELGWEQFVYPVPAGQHTFKWVFNKDYSVSSGADAVWIDNIVFPAIAPVISVEESPLQSQADFYISPNPAREGTELHFMCLAGSPVSVTVYDLTGNKVRDVAHAGMLSPGPHQVRVETSDLSSGMYFIVMDMAGERITKKLIINK
jgi:hypothetical protein